MKYIICLAFVNIVFNGVAQLKVDQYGRVGMGANFPNPGHKCHIAGNLLLSDHPASNFNEFTLKVGNGWPGTEFGSNKDVFAVWYSSWLGYNRLHAESFHKPSDFKLKKNINPISNSLDKIMGLKTYVYEIERNQLSESKEEIKGYKKEYGFVSQEIEEFLTEVDIVEKGKDNLKLMEYDQIIPLTVAAIQEQQKIIEKLQEEIHILNKELKGDVNGEIETDSENPILLQNKPNPFKSNTTIEYNLKNSENLKSSTIAIFNLNGNLIKSFLLKENIKGIITIKEGDLKPGIYIYTLIIEGKEIDSKRMVLLN